MNARRYLVRKLTSHMPWYSLRWSSILPRELQLNFSQGEFPQLDPVLHPPRFQLPPKCLVQAVDSLTCLPRNFERYL